MNLAKTFAIALFGTASLCASAQNVRATEVATTGPAAAATDSVAMIKAKTWLAKESFTLSYQIRGVGEAVYTVHPKKNEVVFGTYAGSACSKGVVPAVITAEEVGIIVFIKRPLQGCGDLKFTVDPTIMVAFSETLNSQNGAVIASGSLKLSPE